MTRAEIGQQVCVSSKAVNASLIELEHRGLIERLDTLPRITFRIVDPTALTAHQNA
jgi:predicted transcriptional regulator